MIDPTREKDHRVMALLLPSSVPFSDSVGLRWSLILILPNPPRHPRKVSIKLHTELNITYFYRKSIGVYSENFMENSPKEVVLWQIRPFPP